MRKPSVTYVISRVEKSLSFEWTAIELHKYYSLEFILLNPSQSALELFLLKNKISVKLVPFYGKRSYPIVFVKLFFYFLFKRPNIIHAHLLDAQLLGLSAAWLAGIRKRFYTRHNSNFHHVYFPKGVFYDRLSNAMATGIVSISQATDLTLTQLEKVNPKRIHKIHHGFNLNAFITPDPDKVQRVRNHWGIKPNSPCIGVVARHIEWKGVQYIIPAFQKLLQDFPTATLVLANARGPYQSTIKELLANIKRDRYILIPFEEDLPSLLACFNIYVHTPVDPLCEAFGQSYIEALAAGIPSVFTLSGIAMEFVKHKKNAWVVNYRDYEDVLAGMKILLTDPLLCQQLSNEGRASAQRFSLQAMVDKLKLLYSA